MSSRDTIDLRPARACESATPHAIGRYAAGELEGEERSRLESHLESCLDCSALLAELRSDDAAFKTTMPFERFAADFERRRERGSMSRLLDWLWPAVRLPAAAGVAAAAATVVMLTVWPAGPDADPGIRTKGSQVGLAFLIKESQGVRHGADGERLVPGDQIQFLVKPDHQARSMVLVGVDGRGAVTVYAAESLVGQVKGELKPRLLPGSVILDDAIGQERFFAVFSSSMNPEELHQRAQSAALELAASGADLAEVEALPLTGDDLAQTSVSIMKVEQ